MENKRLKRVLDFNIVKEEFGEEFVLELLGIITKEVQEITEDIRTALDWDNIYPKGKGNVPYFKKEKDDTYRRNDELPPLFVEKVKKSLWKKYTSALEKEHLKSSFGRPSDNLPTEKSVIKDSITKSMTNIINSEQTDKLYFKYIIESSEDAIKNSNKKHTIGGNLIGFTFS